MENTTQSQNLEVNPTGLRKKTELERDRKWYEKRLDKMRRINSPFFREALRVAELLSETNTLGVHRLIEIFGPELVATKAEEAVKLFQEAKNQGLEAYLDSKEGTAVATKKGQPRSQGGIFFYLMQRYAESLGLDWFGLNITRLQMDVFYNQRPKFKPKVKVTEALSPAAAPLDTEKPVPVTTVAKAANQVQSEPSGAKKAVVPSSVPKTASITPQSAQGSEKKANSSTEAASKPSSNTVKPTRAALKVVGSLVSKPKPQPNGQVGIMELVLKSEMNPGLPKGLPNLGSTRIVVWCTEKQFNKIKNTITAESRIIAEGEMVAAIGTDLLPFVRLICLKLTTVEYEQSLRSSTEQNQSVS